MTAGGVEFAAGPRPSDFPPEWGVPPGSAYSDIRARRVAAHCRRAVVSRSRTPSWADLKPPTLIEQRQTLLVRRLPPWSQWR